MTTSRHHAVRCGALILLIAVGLTVAIAPASADTASAQESALEEALEATEVPAGVEPDESFTVDASDLDDRDDVDEVCWQFNDDETCHDAETEHEFEDIGPHTATLAVTDDDGERTMATNRIVATAAPTAALETPDSIESGSEITLDAGDSSDDHDIVRYEWDLTGDGEVDETTTSPELTSDFESDGAHDVTVTAVDAAGQTDTASETVEVSDSSSLFGGNAMSFAVVAITMSALLLTTAGAFVLSRRNSPE